jgi:hypothetical protein
MSRTPGSTSTRRPAAELRQKAWNSMRVLKRFTTTQIIATAGISAVNLRKYLPALRRAGYLALDRPKRNGHVLGHAIWRLTRDTGPRAPIARGDGTGLYDPNQDRLYPYESVGGAPDDRPRPPRGRSGVADRVA